MPTISGRHFRVVLMPGDVKSNRTKLPFKRTSHRSASRSAIEKGAAKSSKPNLVNPAKPSAMEAHTATAGDGPNVPSIHTSLPPIQDALSTDSSDTQNETIQECLPYLAGIGIRSLFDYNGHGIPSLDREKHIEYLHDRLGELPSAFVAYDAARPWLLYWTLTGLCLLGEDVDQYRSRYSTSLHRRPHLVYC